MTKQQKITLNASRDIPLNKLVLSQSNVRHVKAGVGVAALADEALGFGRIGGIDPVIADRAKRLAGTAFHPGAIGPGDRPDAAQLIAAEEVGHAR